MKRCQNTVLNGTIHLRETDFIYVFAAAAEVAPLRGIAIDSSVVNESAVTTCTRRERRPNVGDLRFCF